MKTRFRRAATVCLAVMATAAACLIECATASAQEALRSRLGKAAAERDQPEVHLRANKLVEYRYVAEVLAESQRLGITKLGMVGNEQFAK